MKFAGIVAFTFAAFASPAIAETPLVGTAAPADDTADVVVVRRDARSEVVVSKDSPLPLIKGQKTEDAILRQAISLSSVLTVVRPAGGPAEETLRWAYLSYLQRQICFTSITGQFSCVVPEVEELTEKASGEASLGATPLQATRGPDAAAADARTAIVTILRTRASALFEDDRRRKLVPMLKAAGVTIRRPPASAGTAPR